MPLLGRTFGDGDQVVRVGGVRVARPSAETVDGVQAGFTKPGFPSVCSDTPSE